MNKNEFPSKASIQTVNTAVAGANFTAFPTDGCTFARVHNPSAVDIEVQRNGAGATVIVPSKAFRNFFGVTDLAQLGVRRVDQSGTQVAVTAEAVV